MFYVEVRAAGAKALSRLNRTLLSVARGLTICESLGLTLLHAVGMAQDRVNNPSPSRTVSSDRCTIIINARL